MAAPSVPSPTPSQAVVAPGPKGQSHTTRNIIIAVVVVLIILIIGVPFALGFYSGVSGNGGIYPSSHSVSIVSGSVAVNANSYTSYQFSVPSGATNVVVSGTFTASGGSGNDIRVYIMTQTDFTNWQNGHQANAYYNSGQVTTDTPNVSLPAGQTYVLVFDNTYSLLSSKTVSAQISLTYTS